MVRIPTVAVCITIFAVACGGTPTNPGRVSVTISRPLSPANGALLLDAPNGGTQSIQLVAAAAVVSTAETPVTYRFEIATDRAFAHDVVVRQTTPAAGVAPSVTFGATIGVRDYFWRVQTTAGSTTAPYSEIFTFNVGFGISITPPTVIAPIQGSLQPVRPTLSVGRATYTGTVAVRLYRFEISVSPSFDPLGASFDVGDYVPDAPLVVQVFPDLATSTTYYWRARAYDSRTYVTSPYSATASFITRAVALQPPSIVAPPSNARTTLRPTLTVGNAARIGPVGPVTYRFEIATDSLFRSPLVSETVPEMSAQTSFVPRADLPAGSPLQWRASATDTLTGVTSDYSHGSLLPLAPHSGVYTLVLRLADDCPTLFKREFAFDGALSRTAVGFLFITPQSQRSSGDLRLDVARAGDVVNGTITSNYTPDRDGYPVSVYERVSNHQAALVAGAVSGNRLAGTFDGYVYVWHASFGLAGGCVASRFTWSVAPAVD